MVYRVRPVQRQRVVLAAMNIPEIEHHDSSNRAEEHPVRGHEIQETTGGCEDLPRHERPREDGAEQLAAADINKTREERGEVVCGGERVCGDVDAEGGEGEGERGEEAAGARGPVRDERHWVPFKLAVTHSAGRRSCDANEGNESEHDGEHGDVDKLPFRRDAGVA